MEKSNKVKIIILSIILILIIIFFFVMYKQSTKTKVPLKINKDITAVTDNSRFYTVTSCVSRYIAYLSTKNEQNLLLLLDNDYKSKNNINSSNIMNYLDDLDGDYEFSVKRMYQEKINEDVMRYYVYGSLEKVEFKEYTSDMDITVGNDYYVIVNMDLEKQIFSIIPYDGQIFTNSKSGGIS